MKRLSLLPIASVVVSATILGAIAPAASAFNFVPQQQGELNVGLGCLDTCIDAGAIFESIVSLKDSSSGSRSRLFVDYFGKGDVTQSYGNGQVVLKTKDAGTNADGFWFRPSEYNESTGFAEEQGQLEVGTYLITFAQELSELTIDFFDTESSKTTGVLAINGQNLASPSFVPSGKDSNIFSQTFTNVRSIIIKLGNDTPSGTGDGVNFRLAGVPVPEPTSVPEPASILGLLAIAGGGLVLKKTA
jgi:hypothetical protein